MPQLIEHVRQSRTLATKFIINKLIEQKRKFLVKMTMAKSARRSCEMEKENLGLITSCPRNFFVMTVFFRLQTHDRHVHPPGKLPGARERLCFPGRLWRNQSVDYTCWNAAEKIYLNIYFMFFHPETSSLNRKSDIYQHCKNKSFKFLADAKVFYELSSLSKISYNWNDVQYQVLTSSY